jgi:hypothetical protein
VKELPFIVVIPSYNNNKWFEKNLDSVFMQKYDNFKVIYVDDASPDKTADFVEQYIIEHGLQQKITLIKNSERLFAMANRYKAIHMCQPHEIVVHLDGDDWFANDRVLSTLNNVYQDSNIWMTYGQFQYYPSGSIGHGKAIPQEVIEKNDFRVYGRIPTALYTFYAGLFHKIKKEDLMFEGKFFQMAHSAYMYPIIEMAGNHSFFMPEVFYIYNVSTSINDQTVNPALQQHLSSIVKQKAKYTPVIKPF